MPRKTLETQRSHRPVVMFWRERLGHKLLADITKSVHMTFIHSCGNLGLCRGGSGLDRRGDLWGLIELGEPVLPGDILFPEPLDLLPQIAAAFPLMMPWALVVPLAAHPHKGVGTGTVRREPEERQLRGTGAPRRDGFGFRHTRVIGDASETGHPGGW